MTSRKIVECMKNELKECDGEVEEIEYSFKDVDIQMHSPPVLDYKIEIYYKNKKRYAFEYETDGVTRSDGADGYYGQYEISVDIDGKIFFKYYSWKSEYGMNDLDNMLEVCLETLESCPRKFISPDGDYCEVDMSKPGYGVDDEEDEEDEILLGKHKECIETCQKIGHIIDEYMPGLYSAHMTNLFLLEHGIDTI